MSIRRSFRGEVADYSPCRNSAKSMTSRYAPTSIAHALAARIERGSRQSMGLMALADDFNFESCIGLGQRGRHIAQRQRVVDAMSECTGGDPAHGLAVVPDRFIPDGVGVGGGDPESHQAQCTAPVLLSR